MEYKKYLESKSKEELISLILETGQGVAIKTEKTFMRSIALKIGYIGWEYKGLTQQRSQKTIEDFIKYALLKSKLWEKNNKIVFAGRTDGGVSAYGMVASLKVKSLITTNDEQNNFNYDSILNSHLPSNIRILGWSYVDEDFNARFGCILRTYKYYFFKGEFDIEEMQKCCLFFKAQKDFKRFSRRLSSSAKKSVVDMEKYYFRPLSDIYITQEENGYCCLNVSSISFLHNMIRKMFWVLAKVGSGSWKCSKLEEILNGDDEIGTGDPNYLVFVEAKYKQNIEFTSNQKLFFGGFESFFLKQKIEREFMKL